MSILLSISCFFDTYSLPHPPEWFYHHLHNWTSQVPILSFQDTLAEDEKQIQKSPPAMRKEDKVRRTTVSSVWFHPCLSLWKFGRDLVHWGRQFSMLFPKLSQIVGRWVLSMWSAPAAKNTSYWEILGTYAHLMCKAGSSILLQGSSCFSQRTGEPNVYVDGNWFLSN